MESIKAILVLTTLFGSNAPSTTVISFPSVKACEAGVHAILAREQQEVELTKKACKEAKDCAMPALHYVPICVSLW